MQEREHTHTHERDRGVQRKQEHDNEGRHANARGERQGREGDNREADAPDERGGEEAGGSPAGRIGASIGLRSEQNDRRQLATRNRAVEEVARERETGRTGEGHIDAGGAKAFPVHTAGRQREHGRRDEAEHPIARRRPIGDAHRGEEALPMVEQVPEADGTEEQRCGGPHMSEEARPPEAHAPSVSR